MLARILRHFFGSPWTAAVLGLALWLHAAAQPYTTFVGGLMEPRRTHCFFPYSLAVARTPDGAIRVQDLDGEDRLTHVFSNHRIRAGGFWAPTSLTTNTTLFFDDLDFESSLTAAERTQVRLQYADRMAEAGMPERWVSALRAGEGVTTTPLRSGSITDAFVLFAAAAFACSLCFIPARIVAFAAAGRRSRAMAAGLCPACGYDLRGLSPGSCCPECGARSESCGICGRDLGAVAPDRPCPECGIRR